MFICFMFTLCAAFLVSYIIVHLLFSFTFLLLSCVYTHMEVTFVGSASAANVAFPKCPQQ